ncbi:FkbM family methyltransferase [Leptolyngbya sp. 7M]|uniref:FkbM family methyltransferase n=1 Tax=Leptolyngbya sp. 7M TaxID=2812896 RepID=UPI001B8BC9B2|nr:FkbM family methyltransferase [Leptolyngbya sp. 7M]QYO66470.1 FkbM family methyltransferase [Leptolyngbya sp. 7M]QYU68186.1 FkbM family methyltransferase [Leptolyngbya sp. 15MV]
MGLSKKIQGIRELWQFDNRFELIFERLFRPGKTTLTYQYKGLKFITDHSAGDANGARALLTSDMYRVFLEMMELPEKLTVLDIGANNGGFPLLLRSEGYPIGKLLSIELNPATFERLKQNIGLNFGVEAECLNAAVCGESRMIAFAEGAAGTSDNIYQTARSGSGKQRSVPGITLDQAIEKLGRDAIDICKMDIEGAEFEIFAGPSAAKLKKCRYLLIEIHHYPEPARNRELVRSALTALGFTEISPPPNDDKHHVHCFKMSVDRFSTH